MGTVEETIAQGVHWLRLGTEAISSVLVGLGVAIAFWKTAATLLSLLRRPGGGEEGFTRIRLSLARYLALGLEFQLAADILSTAVAPSWEQIGKLGAIAVIRTGLNYFLTREMSEEKALLEKEPDPAEPPRTG